VRSKNGGAVSICENEMIIRALMSHFEISGSMAIDLCTVSPNSGTEIELVRLP
jgi:hypothetical protein